MALRSLVGMMKVLPRRVPGSRALATAPKPKGNADLMALREQMPEYEDELYKMFSGHVADGSTSYAPGQRTVHNLTSEEEQEEEEVEEEEEEEEEPDAQAVNTPVSVGSKRSTSSRSAQGFRSTGSSPQKKVKSPVVRAMCDKIGGLTTAIGDSCAFFNETLSQRAAQRAAAMQQAQQAAKDEAERKKKEEEDKIDLIMSLAKECGFTEDSAEWIGVHNIIRDEKAMAWFLKNGIPGRIATIKHYANREEDAGPPVLDSSNDGVVCDGDDDSDEEFDQLLIATFQHQQACAAAALYGAIRCREVLSGGLRVSEPSRVSCSVQNNEAPSGRVSKRRRTTRVVHGPELPRNLKMLPNALPPKSSSLLGRSFRGRLGS